MEPELRLENRHTGEVLRLRRVRDGDQVILEIAGGVPPKGDGPPLHIHLAQREEGRVVSGVMTGVLDGKMVHVRAGEAAVFPAGAPHRWWNEQDEPLEFEGRAEPAGDLDQFLQAVFAAVNSTPDGRMPLFYAAHILCRHRHSHRIAAIPLPVQRVLFPIIVGVGRLLGKYQGDWPGAPASCPGAPDAGRA